MEMRFQNEARALSKLDHENIAKIYDFGLDGDEPYMAMDFVDGPTLQSVLEAKTRLELPEFIEVFTQILNGLAHAHNKNIVHRDLKPGNIIMSQLADGGLRVVSLVLFEPN